MELNKIKRSMHADVIASFWSMLQQLDAQCCDDPKNILLKRQVEAWYAQWNRMTGDCKVARFQQLEISQNA